jgi:hypothetical protein
MLYKKQIDKRLVKFTEGIIIKFVIHIIRSNL